MKRTIKQVAVCLLVGLFTIFSSISAFALDAIMDTNIKVVMDGEDVTLTDAPLVQNNQVLLPLREVAATLGVLNDNGHIIWNGAEKSVTLQLHQSTAVIHVGRPEVYIDAEKISLSAVPILYRNGRVYVPADLVKQTFGKEVTWDASTKTVQITSTTETDIAETISNKEKVVAVLKSFETGDTSALETWINPDYIQHNLAFPSGREVVIEAISQLEGVGVSYDIKRVIEDGDYVFTHSLVSLFGTEMVVFDIYRFEDGIIMEHWDNVQALAEPNPSGRTMIDGATEIMDRDKTEENKALIEQFAKDVFVGENPERFASYYDGDNYIQHNPLVGDGLSSVMEAFEEWAESGPDFSYEKIHMVIGEGNFVLVVGEAKMGDTSMAVYDLFRVENDKIAEHWDVIEDIPHQDEWQNENGKF